MWLNGPPSAFLDPAVRLPIVEEVREPAEGGFECRYKGEKYFRKGVLTPDALIAATVIKKLIKTTTKLLPSLWFIIPFLLIPKLGKKIQWKILEWFSENCHSSMSRFYIKPMKGCTVLRELWRCAIEIFKNESLTQTERILLDRIIVSVGLIFEYDDSYRYRMQDALSLISKEDFEKNPALELKRLYGILCDRDGLPDQFDNDGKRKQVDNGMVERMDKLYKLIRYAFLFFPAIRNKAKEFVRNLDVEKIKLDDDDFYHCLMRYDYRYRGISAEQRVIMKKKLDEEYKNEV